MSHMRDVPAPETYAKGKSYLLRVENGTEAMDVIASPSVEGSTRKTNPLLKLWRFERFILGMLEMSYDGRRNLGACKSNYIAIQSCLGYTGLVLQAEEQMLD